MSIRTIASLVAVSLALAGCKDVNAGLNLLEGKDPDAVPMALAAFDAPAEEPRYTVLDGTGPMGEEIATGADCHASFRVRICV